MNTVEYLQSLHDEHGKLTPELVVEVATDPDCPIHDRFEWDDAIAAHGFRLEQARGLLQLTITSEKRETRAFIHLKSTGAYHPIADVVGDVDWRDEMVAQFRADAKAFERRWRNHKFVAEHFDAWVRELSSRPG